MNRELVKRAGPLCAIVLMWAVFVLPSVFFPNWAFLDDPAVLKQGKVIAETYTWPRPDPISGRHIPLFHVYFGVIYKFFGFDLRAYYAVGAALMLGSLVLIYAITVAICRSRTAGVVSAFLAITASPVTENLYTLGKQEPKVLIFILAALYLFARAFLREDDEAPSVPVTTILAIALLICLGMFMKETTTAMTVFALSGIVASLFFRDEGAYRKESVKAFSLLFVSISAGILFVRFLHAQLTPAGSKAIYTTYPITRELVTANLAYYVKQLPDILLLFMLASVVLVFGMLGRPRGAARKITFAVSLLALAFGYAGGLLIWRWPLGYYMLIPGVLLPIVVVSGIWMSQNIRNSRLLMGVFIALLALSRLYTIPYSVYVATTQKVADRIFTDAVGVYAQRAAGGERLLVEEWPFYNEQVIESNILVRDIYGRKDLKVEGINDLLNASEIPAQTALLYGIREMPARAPRMPRKGDYLLSLSCENPSSWTVRGVSHCDDGSMLNEEEGLELISQRKIAWRGIQMEAPGFFPHGQRYRKEYRLYKIGDWKMISWNGRWSDGWIGRHAECLLQAGPGGRKAIFSGEAHDPAVPLQFEIAVDGKKRAPVSIEKSGPFSFAVDLPCMPKALETVISFYSDRAFVPKAVESGNDDRELSVRILGARIVASDD